MGLLWHSEINSSKGTLCVITMARQGEKGKSCMVMYCSCFYGSQVDRFALNFAVKTKQKKPTNLSFYSCGVNLGEVQNI